MRGYVKRSVWKKGRRNAGDACKKTLLGTCIEMHAWNEVLYAEQGTLLRDCILG